MLRFLLRSSCGFLSILFIGRICVIKRRNEAALNSSLSLFWLLQGFSYGLTDPTDAILIGMSVHPQRGAAVRVSQPCGDTYHVGTVGDGKTGGRVAQLVRVEVLYPIPFAKSLEVTSWSVWVHRLRAVVLRKHPAHRYQLTPPQLLQKHGHVRRDVYNAGLAVFGQGLVHAPLGGVL